VLNVFKLRKRQVYNRGPKAKKMTKIDLVNNLYEGGYLEDEDTIVLSEGFEAAVIGVSSTYPKRMVYDYHKAVAVLMDNDPTTDLEEACLWIDEHTNYKIGDQTPIFIKTI
jgi:hypothetical protein